MSSSPMSPDVSVIVESGGYIIGENGALALLWGDGGQLPLSVLSWRTRRFGILPEESINQSINQSNNNQRVNNQSINNQAISNKSSVNQSISQKSVNNQSFHNQLPIKSRHSISQCTHWYTVSQSFNPCKSINQ